jgi:hypothetical protein
LRPLALPLLRLLELRPLADVREREEPDLDDEPERDDPEPEPERDEPEPERDEPERDDDVPRLRDDELRAELLRLRLRA